MSEVWPETVLQQFCEQLDDQPKCMWPKLARFLANTSLSNLARRDQLEELVSLVEPSTKQKLIKQLRREVTFHPTVRELKAVSMLLNGGIRLAYEKDIDGKTPDWSVLDDKNNPVGVIEVATITTTEAARSIIPLWTCLNEASIKSAKFVRLSTPDHQRKWTDKQIIECIERVRTWCELNEPTEGDHISINNVQFTIGGNRQPGMEICPGIPGHINPKSSDALYEVIKGKACSYKGICQDHQLPLAVVLYTDEEWVSASIEDWSRATTGGVLEINQRKASMICTQKVKSDSLFAKYPLLSAAGWLELKDQGWRTIWLINPNASCPFDSKLFSCGSEAG